MLTRLIGYFPDVRSNFPCLRSLSVDRALLLLLASQFCLIRFDAARVHLALQKGSKPLGLENFLLAHSIPVNHISFFRYPGLSGSDELSPQYLLM